jgi:hypothetical protein
MGTCSPSILACPALACKATHGRETGINVTGAEKYQQGEDEDGRPSVNQLISVLPGRAHSISVGQTYIGRPNHCLPIYLCSSLLPRRTALRRASGRYMCARSGLRSSLPCLGVLTEAKMQESPTVTQYASPFLGVKARRKARVQSYPYEEWLSENTSPRDGR